MPFGCFFQSLIRAPLNASSTFPSVDRLPVLLTFAMSAERSSRVMLSAIAPNLTPRIRLP